MHLRIHFLLLVVLLGYSSTTYAQQAVGVSAAKSVAASETESGGEVAAGGAESDQSIHAGGHTGGWSPRDDIYIDDEDEDDDDEWEGSGVSGGRGRVDSGGGGKSGGGRRKGGRNRGGDDLESSGSGQGPVRRPGDDDEEDVDQGSGAGSDVGVIVHKNQKQEDKKKKPINPPKEPIEEVVRKAPEVTPQNEFEIKEDDPHKGTEKEVAVVPPDEGEIDGVLMDKTEDRATSFFSQPGILAAVIGGAVVGLLCAILVVMFIVYRMRKKDEGSYALDEPKRSPTVNSYTKNSNREFYA